MGLAGRAVRLGGFEAERWLVVGRRGLEGARLKAAAVTRGRRRSGAGQVLLDPVSMPCCGKSFDKACMTKHLQMNTNVAACPNCRKALRAVPPVRVRSQSIGVCVQVA